MIRRLLLLCTGVALATPVFAQYEDTGPRGAYFSKPTYTPAPLPTFAESRARLPQPVLDDRPDYVELYWRAWELAFAHFKSPPRGSPFVSNYLDEAFSPSIFQWDTVFMTLFARYGHAVFPAIESLDNFYSRQYANGYICREIDEAHGTDFVFEGREHTVNPPLFAWAEVEHYRLTGDKSRFAAVLPPLEKYAAWLEQHRRRPGTAHGLYWNTGLGSGMDNSPRRGSGWVDMSVQMALLYRQLAFMARELGQTEKAAALATRADDIAARIQRFMWNEADGLYYDIDDAGAPTKVKTIAAFWPLLAQIPSAEQADRLMRHLKSPREFWRPVPFPSLAADEPAYAPDGRYWLGGVWAPTNFMVIKGLERYAGRGQDAAMFRDFARTASAAYLDALVRVYRTTGTLWENYSPESFTPGVPARPHFVGWTGLGPIALLIENVLGFHADAAAHRLTWDLARRDRHGIRQLHVGPAVVDALCAPRADIFSAAELEVTTTAPLELVVRHPNGDVTFQLAPGAHHLRVAPAAR